MHAPVDAEELARTWIQGWIDGDPRRIPLAERFTHASPFGTFEGREAYLAFMQPMTGTPAPLKIRRTLGRGDEAVIWYELTTPAGVVPCCDWVRIADGEIVAVTAFYDATRLRGDDPPTETA